jgi:HK97 family phage prohead protease
MVLRTKGGEFRVGNSAVLLDFLRGELGVRSEEVGRRSVEGDFELICSTPFRAMNNEEGTMNNEGLAWTLSTFDLDRFGERIDPAGWDYAQYLKNPVVEWAHRYDVPAIGRLVGLAADEKGLHGVVDFNDKEYDLFGWAIGERVKRGVIRAGSVGFRVIEIEIPDKETAQDGTTLIFRKQELLEFSICNVPANPFALVKSEELGVEPSVRRSEGIISGFWGGIISGNR